jgi:hypothetical protein
MASKRSDVDLRDRVEEDRGLIKKIELAIPGFRGYRLREDLRIADSLLRTHLADQLKNTKTVVEECREILTKNMELLVMEDVGKLLNRLNSIENRVRHAEQGITGVSADVRINIDELNDLYEWDLQLMDHIKEMNIIANTFRRSLESGAEFKIHMKNMDIRITDFNELFDRRIRIISRVDLSRKK